MRLTRLLLLLLVDLDKPLVLAFLVLALVSPLGDPFARRFVIDELGVALLVLNTLLLGEELPFGGGLLGGDGLLAGQRRRGLWEDQVHAFGGGFELAGGQELVDEGLGGVAGVG